MSTNAQIACAVAIGLGALLFIVAGQSESEYQVTYLVYGSTGRASLTMTNEQGGSEQRSITIGGSAWRREFTARRGQHLYLSAQNGEDRGSIVCEIRMGTQEWKKSRSEGAYVIATCSGTADGA